MAKHWSNWSASVQSTPQDILFPENESEIQAIVAQANASGQKIRVVGAGHSFTPLVQTDQLLISLDRLTGLISIDKEKAEATVWAGTRLKTLGALLYAHGFAMENLGDIDVQSIAGAISTGTHGSGTQMGSIATQLKGLTLVNGKGELVDLSEEEHQDHFHAAQVSLGTMGIITRMRIRLEPAYKLQYNSEKQRLEDVLDQLDTHNQARSFEFYWFPYTDTVQTKTMNVTDESPKGNGLGAWLNDIVLENGVFWLISKISRFFPTAFKSMSRLSAWGVSNSSSTAWSHNAFATKRLVKFQEMEYNIPAEHFKAAIREIKETIEIHSFRVHFPIECRWVKADQIWLSPAYRRDSAYIAVHMYKGMAYDEYFGAMEGIFKKYNGRPHWGKMHHRTSEELAMLYPKWEDFQNLRREMDPNGTFLNPYLKSLMGEFSREGAV